MALRASGEAIDAKYCGGVGYVGYACVVTGRFVRALRARGGCLPKCNQPESVLDPLALGEDAPAAFPTLLGLAVVSIFLLIQVFSWPRDGCAAVHLPRYGAELAHAQRLFLLEYVQLPQHLFLLEDVQLPQLVVGRFVFLDRQCASYVPRILVSLLLFVADVLALGCLAKAWKSSPVGKLCRWDHALVQGGLRKPPALHRGVGNAVEVDMADKACRAHLDQVDTGAETLEARRVAVIRGPVCFPDV